MTASAPLLQIGAEGWNYLRVPATSGWRVLWTSFHAILFCSPVQVTGATLGTQKWPPRPPWGQPLQFLRLSPTHHTLHLVVIYFLLYFYYISSKLCSGGDLFSDKSSSPHLPTNVDLLPTPPIFAFFLFYFYFYFFSCLEMGYNYLTPQLYIWIHFNTTVIYVKHHSYFTDLCIKISGTI